MGSPERRLNFRQIFSVLVGTDRESRINLFELFPRFRAFFSNRLNILYARTSGDVFFTFLILLGLFGPQDPNRNISLFISWGLWWTSVVLSWFFVGKLWCGVCPFPGLGRLFQSRGISLNLEVPQSLKKVFVHLSVILLGIIIWIESVTNMKEWPAGTAYLLLSILLGATLMGVIFKGQAWCRHVCPLGKIIGSAATIAVTEFRSDRTKCQTCKTMACKLGAGSVPGCPISLGATNVRSNFYCLVCGHCVILMQTEFAGHLSSKPFRGNHLSRRTYNEENDLSHLFLYHSLFYGIAAGAIRPAPSVVSIAASLFLRIESRDVYRPSRSRIPVLHCSHQDRGLFFCSH